MELCVFTLANAHMYGTAFYDFLRLRKQHFVDELGWDIPHNDDVEMDQYDTPNMWYSIVRDQGRVIGGARMASTALKWGEHGYMLGDAAKGMLPGIPPEVVKEGFEGEDVWECTRLVVDHNLDIQQRGAALELLVSGINDTAAAHGATQMIAFSAVTLVRAIRRFGYDPEQIGPGIRYPGDRRTYAMLTMPPWKVDDLSVQAA